MNILVTGGAGYIGSHTCVELLETGYNVAVVDNLSGSSRKAVERVENITGKNISFYEADICDKNTLFDIFDREKADAVIHFAALKSIPDSVARPLEYYNNNVTGTINICEAMKKFGVSKIVLSSSAAVYGKTTELPVKESSPLLPVNPYGRTKLIQEQIICDFCGSINGASVILRYFNPVGAHKSGLIGEEPKGTPSNLVPYISQVACGRLKQLNIYGDDYETPDGTGVRDYIHVVDVAKGHIKAIEKLNHEKSGNFIFNIGTGKGYSVIEMMKSFEKASGKNIDFVFSSRREGDVDACYADVSLAQRELGWKAEYGIDDMCSDAWKWQKLNPEGYR